MAKAESPTGGRELNVHFSDLELRFLGQISHLGDMVPVMAGIALSFKLRGEPRVGLVYIGDGGMSHRHVPRRAELRGGAALPAGGDRRVQRWAYSTPPEKQFAVDEPGRQGAGLRHPGGQVDGNDVLAVYEATQARGGAARGAARACTSSR